MKTIAITFLLSLSFLTLFAQEETENNSIFNRKHEVRIGVIKLLSGSIFEGSYEYIQDNNRGFGASVLINFEPNNGYLENYSLTPFYRMYFQTNEDFGAKGFFAEGFTSFFGGRNYTTYYYGLNSIEDTNDFFDISIGLALGKKWINTAGFVFEIKAGAGRNLLGNSDFDALFKGDVSIGYRF